jgi:hypothetical protein
MAFKDLVKQQRQQGSGILSSVGSAAAGSVRESLDIRNALFSSGSFLNTLFPNVKGFKAGNNVGKGKSPSLLSGSGSDLSSTKLDQIGENTKIAAKNSLVLPSMARDMNVMRQNIVKLVKLQGGTASTKADMFFMKAGEREAAYENQIGGSKQSTSPTKASDEGGSGGIKSFLMKLLGGLLAVLAIGVIKFFTDPEFKEKIKESFNKFIENLGLEDILIGLGLALVGTTLLFGALTAGIKTLLGVLGAAALGGLSRTPTTKTPPSKTPPSTGAPGSPGTKAPAPGSPGSGRRGRQAGVKRDPKTGRFIKAGPSSAGTWSRFIEFVKKRDTQLFKMIGKKLATMAILATIPIVGWVLTAISFGLSITAGYQLYQLWQQFNEEEGIDIGEDTEIPSIPSELGAGEFAGMEIPEPASALPSGAPTAPSTPTSTPASSNKPTPQQIERAGATPDSTSPTVASGASTSTSSSNLLDIIAGGESGSMGYDAANKGKAGDMPGGYPGLSKMTVDDVMRLQAERKVFATGRYQIIPSTLAGLMNGEYGETGVKGSDLYDASTQDKLVTALINKRLKQGGSDPIKQQFALSQEFASIANPYTGSSYYDKGSNVGRNKASIGTETIQAALTGSPSTGGATLASATPAAPTSTNTVGASLNAGSVQVADGRMSMGSGQSVVVNAPQTNVQAPQVGQRSSGNIPSVVDTDFMRHLVAQLVT